MSDIKHFAELASQALRETKIKGSCLQDALDAHGVNIDENLPDWTNNFDLIKLANKYGWTIYDADDTEDLKEELMSCIEEPSKLNDRYITSRLINKINTGGGEIRIGHMEPKLASDLISAVIFDSANFELVIKIDD